jgi:hypothetical protein
VLNLAVTTKKLIAATWLYGALSKYYAHKWSSQGSSLPPPHFVKEVAIREYAAKFGLRTFVETGTLFGEMVAAMTRNFDRIISIELDPTLASQARRRFKRYGNVTILQGDSGVMLPGVLRDIAEPCLLWLDGHYSGGVTARGNLETPVLAEITHVLGTPVEHVLLVDDARLFTGVNDYPTLKGVRSLQERLRPGWRFEVRDDVIRIYPLLPSGTIRGAQRT